MALETQEDQKTPMSTAQALEEEMGELHGELKQFLAEAAKYNDKPDMLMRVEGIKRFEGLDEHERYLRLRDMEMDQAKAIMRASVHRTVAGMEALQRTYDAFHEKPEFADLGKFAESMQTEAAKYRGAVRINGDYGWENFGAKVREYSGEDEWSPDAFKKALKEADGLFSADKAWEGGWPGFSFESETQELTGIKALLSSQTTGSGIQPYPEQMALIVEQAIRRPSLFRVIASQSVRSNSYQFRQESGVEGQFRYANEPPATIRTELTDSMSLTIAPTTKTLKTAIGMAVMNYEQLYTEPIARNWIRRRLIEQFEIWLDTELFDGAGGTGAVTGLYNLCPDSTTPITPGTWSSGTGGLDNRYLKATSGVTDLQTLFHGMVHAEVEDHGMSVPMLLGVHPETYEELVNPTIQSGDTRWLFPTVMAGGVVQPLGLTVVKNIEVQRPASGGDAFLIDPRHLSFRPHAQGVVLEYEKAPRQLVEYMVAHLLFEFDSYRTFGNILIQGLG